MLLADNEEHPALRASNVVALYDVATTKGAVDLGVRDLDAMLGMSIDPVISDGKRSERPVHALLPDKRKGPRGKTLETRPCSCPRSMLPHLYGQACYHRTQWGLEPLASDVFSCEPFVCVSVESNIAYASVDVNTQY